MSEICFIEARPRHAATGEEVIVRLAGGGLASAYHLGGQHYRAGIVAMPRFRAAFAFDDDGWTGGTVPTSSAIGFMPGDGALLGSLSALYWRDSAITIDVGDEKGPLVRRLTGIVADIASNEGQIALALADPSKALDKPFLGPAFDGSGGLEGPAEAAGRAKRRSFGLVFNVQGELIDKAHHIYEFGDPAHPLARFREVRDKGRAGPAVELDWRGSAAETFAALQAAAAPQGGCVMAPSIACVKWWTDPSGPLTADIEGEVAGGYTDTAVGIAARLLVAVNGPVIADQAIAEALRPASCGIHISAPDDSVAQAIDRLLLGCSLYWVLQPDGVIRIGAWAWTPPVAQFHGIFIGRERQLPPVKSRQVGYRRNHRVHQASEISAAVLLADDVTYLDGTPIEDLKPAEPGATDGATVGNGDNPGNIRDETGAIRPASDLLNQALTLTEKGRLQIEHGAGVAELRGQVTSALEYLSGQTMEALKPAEAGSTAGAVIPSAGYAGAIVGGIRDELGALRASADLLNTSLALDASGALSIDRGGGVRQVLGQVTVDALGAASAAAARQQQGALDRLAAVVTMIDTRVATVQGVIRDAGIYVDPDNGRVTISAIDATNERISSVSFQLDALSTIVALTASRTYVDNAIAVAVLEPSQVPIFSALEVRLTSAELRLDGAEAALISKAEKITVDALTASVVTVSESLDALVGVVSNKVDSVTFDLVETRVASVEDSLSALGDVASIERGVSVARMTARQLDEVAANDLAGLLANDARQRDTIAALARASEEITTRLIDGDTAEAQARALLGVRVGTAEAAITTEQTARANADGALAGRIDVIEANYTTPGAVGTAISAAVGAEATARANADSAIGSRIDSVETNLTTETTNRTAAVSSEASARSTADSALSGRISTIEADYTTGGDVASAVSAGVGTEAAARASADGALSGRIDTVEAGIATETSNRNAAITAEALARAGADGALEAIIAQKASTTRVDGIDTRVASAETVIAALGDVAGMQRDISVSRRAADEIAANDLAGLLAQDQATRTQAAALARASEEITTRLLDGDAAEAASRAALTARVGSAEAAITSEQTARAGADGALSTRIDSVEANLSTETANRTAAVNAEAVARTNADSALSGRITTIEASYVTSGAMGTAVSAAVAGEASARSAADSALAGRIDTIEADYTTSGAVASTVSAAIGTEAAARAAADGAMAGRLDSIEADYATTGAVSAAVNAEAVARANADGALATTISGVSSTVNGHTASISSQATAISDANTQIASLLTQLSAQGVTVSDLVTAISTISGEIAGRRTIAVDAEGRWTGIDIIGAPSIGVIRISADVLTIDSPSGRGVVVENGDLRVLDENGIARCEMGYLV